MALDLYTIYFVTLLLNSVFALYLGLLRGQYRADYAGVPLVVAALAAGIAGNTGLALQGFAPPLVSVVAANALAVAGFALASAGLRRFLGLPTPRPLAAVLVLSPLAIAVEQYVFVAVAPDILVRTISVCSAGVFLSVVALQALWTQRRRLGLPGAFLAVCLGIQAGGLAARIVVVALVPTGPTFLLGGGLHAAIVFALAMASCAWPIGFAFLIAHLAREKARALSLVQSQVLDELRHRTRNNLQLLSALISLQREAAADPAIRAGLADAARRINALAIAHRRLYSVADLTVFPLAAYLSDLAAAAAAGTERAGPPVVRVERLADLPCAVDLAIPLGFIANELLVNCYKHAFPGRPGRIEFTLAADGGGRARLEVADDGVGVPSGCDPAASDGLGLRIVSDLAEKQLGGSCRFRTVGGFACAIEFPLSPAGA